MKNQHAITRFLRDETGAVSVDWVVLTAATVGLGMAVVDAASQGMEQLGANIAAELSSIEVRVYPDEE